MTARALTLAIEASNPSAATADGGPAVAAGFVGPHGMELLGVEPLRAGKRHDDDLLSAVDRLWSRLGRDRAEIDTVAVSIGPGGYTGLRIAVVAAKLIAEAVGARCVGIPSAWVVARRAAPDVPRPFGVALASKGETSVLTTFDAPETPRDEPRELDAHGLSALGLRALIADHHLPAPMREWCAGAGVRIDPPRFDPAACLEASAGLERVDPARLVPIYGREPEAVRKWRELHGRRA